MLPLRRDRTSDHHVVLYLEKVFWTLVIFTLALLLGGLMLSPGALLSSPVFVVIFGACLGLWCLHAVQVYTHREELRHDVASHRARERRGF
jgi:fatty acid desaturase